MFEVNYSTKFEKLNDKTYDALQKYLNSFGREPKVENNESLIYCVGDEDHVVNLNQKKNTIELSDKVYDWVFDDIKGIVDSGEWRGGFSAS